ncbi:hypothetical protein JCM10450v2_000970 [Rhodotorula kratochvilovae]
MAEQAKAHSEQHGDAPALTPAVQEQRNPAWTSTYDALTSKLPGVVAKQLPSSSTAATAVAAAQTQLTSLGKASKERYTQMRRTASETTSSLTQASRDRFGPDQWLACAWSVTNQTQVPLNVALCQVGPLYYEVLPPDATFERRVPNLWFALEVRPYTSPSTAYNAWSTTWPILCVTGPAVAVTSLLALPFVAVAAGGTALASLAAIGSSIASGAAAAAESVGATAVAAAGFAAKVNRVPGAGKVKGKLADAARDLVGEHISRDKVQQHVVRYLTKGAGAAGAAGAASGGPPLLEDEARTRRAKKEKKLEEIDVTGYAIDKVLKCETGHAATDKALVKAFKRLSFKTKFTEYRTQDNPVLRVVGGPELETRTPAATFFHPNPSPRQVLVFYPFALLHSASVVAEPLGADEAPPTADEQRVMSGARVVESYEEAEKAVEKAPAAEGAGAAGAKGKEAEVDRAVEEAKEEVAGAEGVTVTQETDGEPPAKKKKGWLW